MKKIILTTMCLLVDNKGRVLVENRLKKDWPGLTFPGGHVEDNETIEESCIREIKEETGLTITSIKCNGYIEWNLNDVRHLCVLFKALDFDGELHSSNEGEVFFLDEKDFDKFPKSNDFDLIYQKLNKN